MPSQPVCPEKSIRLIHGWFTLASTAMIALIRLVLGIVTSLFKSTARLEAEIAALRRQVIVLRRKVPGRVTLTNSDRTFFVWLLSVSTPE